MPRIFVSYRRAESRHVTGRILDHLVTEFGVDSVFHDLTSIPLGQDFRKCLEIAVNECDVLLAIIGREWESSFSQEGGVDEPAPRDFVRYEIGAALERKVPVIPILIDRMEVPEVSSVPAELEPICTLQGLPIRDGQDFLHDTERLMARLREIDERQPERFEPFESCRTVRRPIRVTLVRNGPAEYARAIARGFRRKTEEEFPSRGYEVPHFQELEGDPSYDGDEQNRAVFHEATTGFGGQGPDFLVSIGTGVSEYAKQHFLDRFPIIFVGVSDPVSSGLVRTFAPDPQRGNIAGTTYGVPVQMRLEFLLGTFPRIQRFGFISNPRFHQDIFLSREIRRLAREELNAEDRFVIVTVDEPMLTAKQEAKADLFFGFYYLNLHMQGFLDCTKKPIVGLNEEDLKRGAIASTGNNDERLGELAAREYLVAAVVLSRPLCSRPIIEPLQPDYGLNLGVAGRLGIEIPQRARAKAKRVEW